MGKQQCTLGGHLSLEPRVPVVPVVIECGPHSCHIGVTCKAQAAALTIANKVTL